MFASGPAPRAPAPLAPTGKVTRTDGGFRLRGRWEWATGIMHADWVMVTAMDPEGGPRFCVLPRAEVEVEDVWKVAGMAATGSNNVVVRDAFVPEHRTLEMWRIKMGQTPGEALHAGTNVGWPLGATLALVAATPALGAAEGGARRLHPAHEGEDPVLRRSRSRWRCRRRISGWARRSPRCARRVWSGATRSARSSASARRERPRRSRTSRRSGSPPRTWSGWRTRRRTVSPRRPAPARAFLSSPLQRNLRDLQMIRGHVIFDWDRAAQIGGKVALGIEPTPADLL